MRSMAAALSLVAAALAAISCNNTCTDVPAETRTFVLGRDAGPDAPTGPRPLDECKALCGDSTDESAQPHVTACRVTMSDAGDSIASCDETAYRLCAPQ